MNLKAINENKIPIVKIDKRLERFRGKSLFPEKLEKANEILTRVGLPKGDKHRTANML
jgi:hypothetical protein